MTDDARWHTLRSGGTVVVVDVGGPVPAVVHWGRDPGETIGDIDRLLDRPQPPAVLAPSQVTPLVALRTNGDDGPPGLAAHGFPRLAPSALRFSDCRVTTTDGGTLRFESSSPTLTLHGRLTLGATLVVDLSVTNTSAEPVAVDRLAVTLPIPAGVDEVLCFEGRWAKELIPRRATWEAGALVIENRRGRTSHDRAPLLFAGRRGFGERAGDVWGVHVAWSGNTEVRAERLADGRRIVQAGELLSAGEVQLAPGATYAMPSVHGAWGDGLNAASHCLHRAVRASQPSTPRPVMLNTWEAVYFDHDLDRLRALADRAAAVGVERFVLDDGWFGGRRNDGAGLGDWWVSPDVYPDGLEPLIDHVTGLGMGFGIWVEPEMVNPDSDLHRAHPEWVLGDPEVLGRHQLVLDLSIDACWEHLHGLLDRLLADHAISYVKWDMNRDLEGAGAHAQTLALYRLIDTLRASHPTVEFESCASGGGRADLAILERTQRIWTSDCNDALERQMIQRGFSYLFPPSVMGAHIGPPRAHTTGRTHRLHFRAATALFGHLGIEWNLLEVAERDLDTLRAWVDIYKELRSLLHGGDVVRIDSPDPAGIAHGVVAGDRSIGVFCWAQLTTSVHTLPPRLVLDGLDPTATYRVTQLATPGARLGLAMPPAWVTDGAEASGAWLIEVGIQLPAMNPESALLIRLDRTA